MICLLLLYFPFSAFSFIHTLGTHFLDSTGAPFRFAGTNNYYLLYQDGYMVEDVFARASLHNFSVIRTWGFLDIGYSDGSESVGGGPKNGVWLQGMDKSTRALVYNESGFQHFDRVLALAAKYKIHLILTLTNNWSDFGGVDQYVRWETQANASYQTPHHDDFFTSEWQAAAYLAYFSFLANRVNTITGIAYKEDPVIFAWELANEFRCQGSGVYSSTNNCTLHYAEYNVQPIAFKIPPWVARMSQAIKAIDPNHLVAVGDEGFLCEEYQVDPDMSGDCYVGTDFAAFTSTKDIDFASFHLYPDSWGKSGDWGSQWIMNHTLLAHALGKPIVLGEFGFKSGQSAMYSTWGDVIVAEKTDGDLFWMLCGAQDYHYNSLNAPWYPDYDGFCVYCPNATEPTAGGDSKSCGVLTKHANAMIG